jgi:hypothetical protein
MNDFETSKLDANPFAVARLKASLDKKNMMEVAQSFMQYGETADGRVTTPDSQIDHNNWRNDFGVITPTEVGAMNMGQTQNVPSIGEMLMGDFGSTPKKWLDKVESEKAIAPKTTSLSQFLADDKSIPKLQAKGVNVDLARTMWQTHQQQ